MRIAYITPEFVTEPYFSGWLANYLGRVTTALAERGHDVHVLVRAKSDEQLDYKGVKVHRVLPIWDRRMIFDHVDPLVPRTLYTMYQDIKAAWCLRRRWLLLNKKKPFGLIQIPNVNNAGLFFRFERRCPVVARLSSHPPTWDKATGVRETPLVRFRWMI